MSLLRNLAKRITPVRRMELRRRNRRAGVRGQSNEAEILRILADDIGGPKTFIEFGFHPAEFNCSSLLTDHRGLLIDGSARQVADGNAILPGAVECKQSFITLENMGWIADHFDKVGVLSIDVDGNDYWFLERLIEIEPAIICVEYNASLLKDAISTPYDPAFERHAKHMSGWYHGASLTALAKLCGKFGYGLAAVAEAGGNAFFTKTGLLDPETNWKSSRLRDELAGNSADQQWDAIKHMPFARV
ncbi:MAG: hypothetical protein Q7T68_11170 [Sphingopyxis sp.]|nr:hypothetical protein [Sphingopyxis sp.]